MQEQIQHYTQHGGFTRQHAISLKDKSRCMSMGYITVNERLCFNPSIILNGHVSFVEEAFESGTGATVCR